MKKKQYRKGHKFGVWILVDFLGSGGNGEVWECSNKEGVFGAIKLLRYNSKKTYLRFLDEIKVMEDNSDIVGMIPILDKFLPVFNDKKEPYFVMGIAKNAEKELKGKSIEEKINTFLEVCTTIKELHSRGISHRDIKLSNLLIYNSRLSICDFGLVDFPSKRDNSINNEEIGAKWTIAPEMRRSSSTADGLKADIYSLAKTLWIILTESSKGFDGQYIADSKLGLNLYFNTKFTSPIDKLLTVCTDNDPNLRMDIDEFIFVLEDWKILNEDFSERNQEQWFEIQNKLFPTSFPKRVIWENPKDIIKVLKIVSSYKNLNHVFFPTGGGLDLEGANLSVEEGCIELEFSSIHIVKPHRLLFESFSFNPEWNYFRLDLSPLERALENPTYGRYNLNEEVTQIYPGHYEDYNYLEESYYWEQDNDEYDRPNDMKHVTRWFSGSFVIFSKSSTYNSISSTYDARHNKMDSDEFRNYIQRAVDSLRKEEDGAKSVYDILLDNKNSKRRKYIP